MTDDSPRQRLLDYIWSYNAADRAAPRDHWRHFLQIIAVVLRDLAAGMLTLRAMSLVYTTLLSIVPLLAVSISVLKGFGVHDQLEPTLNTLLAPLGPNSAEISARMVGFVENMKLGVLGALGLALLIYTAISLITKIEAAFNYCWRLRGKRRLVNRVSNYLSLIMVGPVLMFSAVALTASLRNHRVVGWLDQLPYMTDVMHGVGKVLPFVLVIATFTFIYLVVPNTRVRWRSALYGAAIAGILWETTGILFANFAGGSTSYTAVYSGLAILLLFMIWLYISWLILLTGASIAYYHQHPERLQWRLPDGYMSARLREQIALQAMVDIGRAHDRGAGFAPSLETLAARQRADPELLERMLEALEGDGLLKQSADSTPRYLPAAAIDRIRIADILASARNAEDRGKSESWARDDAVGELLEGLRRGVESRLGERTLAEFIRQDEEPA